MDDPKTEALRELSQMFHDEEIKTHARKALAGEIARRMTPLLSCTPTMPMGERLPLFMETVRSVTRYLVEVMDE